MPHSPRTTTRPSLWMAALTTAMMAATSHAADAPPIKPGLWEMVTESQQLNGKDLPDPSAHMARMAEQLKKMPPEMRKQMEATMKAQGLQMTPAQGGGMAMRMCMTKEMLDQDRWMKTDGQCRNLMTRRTGDTWHWKFTCTQPPSQGEGTTTMTSSEAYKSQVHMTSQQNGQAQTMDIKHRAKWLSADCGDVKPFSPPPLKK